MNQTSNTNATSTEESKLSIFIEWSVRIGIVALLVVFAIAFFIVSLKYPRTFAPNPNVNTGTLIWDSLINVATTSMVILDIILSLALVKHAKQLRKSRIAGVSILFFLTIAFDYVSIQYPLHPCWVALWNLVAIIICITIVLFQKKETVLVPVPENSEERAINAELKKTLGDTNNRRIIAVQLYRVVTSKVTMPDKQERVQFDVRHVFDDFVRDENDVNCISHTHYILDREIVDDFTLVVELYCRFRDSGDYNQKQCMLTKIEERITSLQDKLKDIDSAKRPVTRDDCCIARALTLFLSLKQTLCPDPDARVTAGDIIGEISLHTGALQLSDETEQKLFSLYRTGLLGAALLDTDMRHVFYHSKEGPKAGRKYSVSKLICDTPNTAEGSVSQDMYICVFVVQDDSATGLPGYLIKSISEREKEITAVLRRMKKGNNEDA